MSRRRKKPQGDRSLSPQAAPPLQPMYPEFSGPGATPQPPLQAPPEAPPVAPAPTQPQQAAAPGERRSRRRRKRGGRGRQRGAAATPAPQAPPEAAEPAPVVESVPAIEAPPQPVAAPVPPPAPRPKARGVVVLAIGLPGSGKSSWFRRHGITPLSSDLLRTLLFDNIAEQRYQDLVFSTLRSLLRARLIAHMPWNYVDATNLSPKERRGWIKMSREFGFEVHAVYFDVALEVCQERNRRRQRIVPDDVMQRMAGKLRPPTFEEGFSKITVVRVKQAPQAATPEQLQPEPDQQELREEEQAEDY